MATNKREKNLDEITSDKIKNDRKEDTIER